MRRCAESEAGDRQHVRTSPPRAATTSRSPADTIVAEPGTLTGSIGAFGGKLNLLGLYHKLGLNVETVSRGRHAEMFSPFEDFTPEEAERFQQQMDEVYRVVREPGRRGARPIRRARVDSVGQGRVWTGSRRSIWDWWTCWAGCPKPSTSRASMAGIGEDEAYQVDVYPRVERSFFQRLFSDLWGNERTQEARVSCRRWCAPGLPPPVSRPGGAHAHALEHRHPLGPV